MLLSEVKIALEKLETIEFKLPNHTLVPAHFHVTEIGLIKKSFIDCGGTKREERVINFQLWSADDCDHRLHPEKLFNIIELSEIKLGLSDLPVEIEYQGKTIEKYNLEFDGKSFLLNSQFTDCLAKSECGLPEVSKMIDLASETAQNRCKNDNTCC